MEKMIKILLWSYCVNYPLIERWGYSGTKPIALIFDADSDVLSYVSGLGIAPRVLDASASVHKVEEDLRQANSDGVFFVVRPEDIKYPSNRLKTKLALVASSAQLHRAGDVKTRCASFFCFKEFVPPEFSIDVFAIRLTGGEDGDQAENYFQLVPEPRQFELIRDKLRNCPDIEPNAKWLWAACGFLYPKLAEMGKESVYTKLLEEIPTLVEADEAYHDRDAVIDLAADLLLDLADQGKFNGAYDLSAGSIDVDINSEWINNQFFYRGRYLFISEKSFRLLFDPILRAVPIDMLKDRLATAGIIAGDGDRYTAKVYLRSKSGAPMRTRMMRFDMSRIINEDGVDLVDFIRYSGRN